jgi:agmatine deiminase
LDSDPGSFDHSVTKKHLKTLRAEFGDSRVITVSPPSRIPKGFDSESFAAGYINYYLVNGGVIAPKFGDSRADQLAREILESAYPDREVVMIEINSIAAGRGGIHCSTLHQPRAGGL